MSTGMKTENYISYQLLQKKRSIRPIDKKAGEKVRRRWDSLAKPLDSLGKFEELTARMGAMLEDADFNWKRRAVLVMCADNGVVAEGISQCGQEVTLAVCKSMGQKKSSVGKMAVAYADNIVSFNRLFNLLVIRRQNPAKHIHIFSDYIFF